MANVFKSPEIPAFVINCDRDHDRLSHMRDQFASINMDFRRIRATDKFELTKAQKAKYSAFQARLSSARGLSDGEIACAYSHYTCWDRIVSENIPLALILEDDVTFDQALPAVLTLAEAHQDTFDILNLRTDRKPDRVLQPVGQEYQLVSFAKRPNRACAYLLTNSAAQRLIHYRFPIRMPVDDLLGSFRIHKTRVRGLSPSPIDLSDHPSSIWSGLQPNTVRHRGWRKARSIVRLFSSYY